MRKWAIAATPSNAPMTSPKYDFRQFQEELARLESKSEPATPAKAPGKKPTAAQQRAAAREEFLALRKRHGWSVAAATLPLRMSATAVSQCAGEGVVRSCVFGARSTPAGPPDSSAGFDPA